MAKHKRIKIKLKINKYNKKSYLLFQVKAIVK